MSQGFESIKDFRMACRALRDGWMEQQPEKELEVTRKILLFINQRKDSPSSDRAFIRALGRLKESPRFQLLCDHLSMELKNAKADESS